MNAETAYRYMNAETAYRYYHAYKLFYSGKYDPTTYRWSLPNLQPLAKASDRHFFTKLTNRLYDADIHGLYTVGFFHKPAAYIADLMTPEMISAGIRFAARAQAGRVQLENDLYTLRKTLDNIALDEWLYGEVIDGKREAIPPCIQMVLNGELDIDVAALLLLIPQPWMKYDWHGYMSKRPIEMAFGPLAFTKKLETADRLIRFNRPGWRLLSQEIAATFWKSVLADDIAAAGETGLDLSPAPVDESRSLF